MSASASFSHSPAPTRAITQTVIACAASLALHAVALGALTWMYRSATAEQAVMLDVEIASVYLAPAPMPATEAVSAAPPEAQESTVEAAAVVATAGPESPRAVSPAPDAISESAPPAQISALERQVDIEPAAVAVVPPEVTRPTESAVTAAAPPGEPERTALEWRVQDWLAQHRSYPRAARRAGYEGIVWVRFVLDREGGLRGSELMRSSGHALLDRAALDLLRRASPFPALPAEITLDEIELVLPIEYDLTGARG